MFKPDPRMKNLRPRNFPWRPVSYSLTAIVGEERKARFAAYCREHDTSQTKMICQMIDHCIGTGGQ